MAAICLHFHEPKDESFSQYLNAFVEISVIPTVGETVTVNGIKHIVSQVQLDAPSQCAQVYLSDFEDSDIASYRHLEQQQTQQQPIPLIH